MLYLYSQKKYEKVIDICDYFDIKGISFYHQQYKGFSYLYLNQKELSFDIFNKWILNDPSKNNHLNLSCFYSYFDEYEKAIEHLEKSLKLGYNNWSYLDSGQTLNKIRDSKEFKKLINKYKK